MNNKITRINTTSEPQRWQARATVISTSSPKLLEAHRPYIGARELCIREQAKRVSCESERVQLSEASERSLSVTKTTKTASLLFTDNNSIGTYSMVFTQLTHCHELFMLHEVSNVSRPVNKNSSKGGPGR